MKELFDTVFKNEKYSLTVRSFTIVQLIFIVGLTLMTGVIRLCIKDPFYTYLTVILILIFIVALFDANRTGRQRMCAIIMSIVLNFIYFPLCYIGFNRQMVVVPMYFILGLLYTGLLVDGRTGIILSVIEMIFMSFVVMHLGYFMPSIVPGEESIIEVIAIAVAIVVVGFFCAIAVWYRLVLYNNEQDKLEDVHLKVIDAYNQKDIFLANTSHEIRTPLNAIVGTVNILLDEDLDVHVRENVYNILNSCNALLSITDELMDLSNTEKKTLDISTRRYDFNEMLSDIINMISVRLMETEIDFFVDLDKDLPRYLIGDNTKIRQLFINILNNAVKYTKTGSITLRVKGERTEDKGHITLFVEVEDTGIGIKEENLANLFDFYKRDEDSEKRDIEGNGIGLNLCKEIVEMMGGNISVKSEYHVGSTFSFNLKQQVDDFGAIVKVPEKDKYKVLIFERNEAYSKKLKAMFEYMGIEVEYALNRTEFETYILEMKYNHIFIASERYVENKRFIDRKITSERIILISDISQSVNFERSGYMITRPVYVVNASLALLNESNSFTREIIKKGGFKCPNTTIMVVDDNLTNLEVASGIMKRYEANIITALSGAEALNILQSNDVDIIFLDYMMPEMNGIDTLYEIRSLPNEKLKTVPTIALTANVVNGAKEMFLEAGFDDYIAKPIDISKLEKTLKNLLPREQIVIKE